MPDPMYAIRSIEERKRREREEDDGLFDGIIAQILSIKTEPQKFVAPDPRHSLELCGYDPTRFGFKPLRTGDTRIDGIPVGSKE